MGKFLKISSVITIIGSLFLVINKANPIFVVVIVLLVVLGFWKKSKSFLWIANILFYIAILAYVFLVLLSSNPNASAGL